MLSQSQRPMQLVLLRSLPLQIAHEQSERNVELFVSYSRSRPHSSKDKGNARFVQNAIE